jgi:hypothetical protein
LESKQLGHIPLLIPVPGVSQHYKVLPMQLKQPSPEVLWSLQHLPQTAVILWQEKQPAILNLQSAQSSVPIIRL